MPPKQAITTTPGTSSSQGDTSMGEALVDSQVVTMAQLKSVISQIEGNTEALNKRLTDIGTAKIKLLTVERYNGSRIGLKGYLTQILLKIKTKALKLSSAGDTIVYIGIFLIGRVLEIGRAHV